MFLDIPCMSEIGRATSGHLDSLRKQLGRGVDPAFDYAQLDASAKTMHGPKDQKDADKGGQSGSTGLDQLRRALRDVVGSSTAQEEKEEEAHKAAHATGEHSHHHHGRKHDERPSWAFKAVTRDHANKLLGENVIRAPPVGTYRPKMDLIDPRVQGLDMTLRDPLRNRRTLKLEEEIHKLQAEGKPYDHLLKDITSIDLLEHVPERQWPKVNCGPELAKGTARPDMIKLANIQFNDNTFTDHVLDGDYATSALRRTPSWEFSKSVAEAKSRETYFQPGQYKPNLDATRARMETKNIPWGRQVARKSLTLGNERAGDHLPDRSLARSCPALSTYKHEMSPQLANYLPRPPMVSKKPYHNFKDSEVDATVMKYAMTFSIMDKEKSLWKVKPVVPFNKDLSREQQLKTMRCYGSDVNMSRAKESLLRGPSSVELLTDPDSMDSSPQLRRRVAARDFFSMAGRERESNYCESPSRKKDPGNRAKFEREHRNGESRIEPQVFSPLAGAISELRLTRTYDALGATI